MSGRDGRVSREMLAFRSLMEGEGEEDPSPPGQRNPSRKAAAKRAQQRRGKAATTTVPGFALRDAQRRGSVFGAGSSGTAGSPPGVGPLTEMFPHVDHVLLSEVYAACGSSVDAAADALLAMDLGSSAASCSDAVTQPGTSRRRHLPTGSVYREGRACVVDWKSLCH